MNERGAINNQACPLITSILYVQSLINGSSSGMMVTSRASIKICPSITQALMMETRYLIAEMH